MLKRKPNATEEAINSIIVDLKEKDIISTENISDKWHTFDDLYNHRMAFNIALCNAIDKINSLQRVHNIEFNEEDPAYGVYCYKSKKHYNNEKDPMFEGSFIVVIETPNGQISYHYKLENWEKFKIEERDEPNKYDGHTPDDTIDRLIQIVFK